MTTALPLVPLIWAALCWLLSLRRTPFAVGWLALSGLAGGLGATLVSVVASSAHTAAGLVAIAVAGCVVPTVFAACVEELACANPGSSPSDIARWRKQHSRHQLRPPRWAVTAKTAAQWVDVQGDHYYSPQKRISLNETVHVRLEGGGSASVLIASVNVTDEDYEEQIRAAVARGEERALTLNALLTS